MQVFVDAVKEAPREKREIVLLVFKHCSASAPASSLSVTHTYVLSRTHTQTHIISIQLHTKNTLARTPANTQLNESNRVYSPELLRAAKQTLAS